MNPCRTDKRILAMSQLFLCIASVFLFFTKKSILVFYFEHFVIFPLILIFGSIRFDERLDASRVFNP